MCEHCSTRCICCEYHEHMCKQKKYLYYREDKEKLEDIEFEKWKKEQRELKLKMSK